MPCTPLLSGVGSVTFYAFSKMPSRRRARPGRPLHGRHCLVTRGAPPHVRCLFELLREDLRAVWAHLEIRGAPAVGAVHTMRLAGTDANSCSGHASPPPLTCRQGFYTFSWCRNPGSVLHYRCCFRDLSCLQIMDARPRVLLLILCHFSTWSSTRVSDEVRPIMIGWRQVPFFCQTKLRTKLCRRSLGR